LLKPGRQVLLRTLPEWLRLLWSVDSLKANFVLLVVGVQDGDGIAIGNTNDTAGQGVGVGRAAEEEHHGTPETIRTSDPCLRRAVLYPTELRARAGGEA
jgi:hypothetical protein